MHKPSISRIGLISALGAALGVGASLEKMSTPQLFHRHRGRAPTGKRWAMSGFYIPAGKDRNVEPSPIKNQKIAAHIQMMHEKWLKTAFKPIVRQAPDTNSVTSIKWRARSSRRGSSIKA